MTEKRLNRILAVVFLIVGIMASINTFRLHSYINQTLPRDQAQEECQDETLRVLNGWVDSRIKRDNSMDVRDETAEEVLSKLLAGQQPTPEEFTAWRDAVIADREVRQQGTADNLPPPNC